MSSSQQPKQAKMPSLTLAATDENDADLHFYSKFDETHGKESRKEWYNQATAAYIEARPRYPKKMMLSALKEARLWGDTDDEEEMLANQILEIGCGPGTATVELVKMGYNVTAIDPAPQNCIAARQQCQEVLGVDSDADASDRVTVIEATFEDYQHDANSSTKPVYAVLCPTSFHWISPEVACTKTAAILRPTLGCLLLWWAMPPMPSTEICEQLQDIYDDLDESKLGQDMQRYCGKEFSQRSLARVYQGVNDSGLYEQNDKPLELQPQSFRYTPQKLITLLSTLSPYIALEEQKRLVLFDTLLLRLQGICKDQDQAELELTGYFGFQCFWVKPGDE
ncbi:MAG: hypothetical protein SGILL_004824 [Bacillariaceae sp.]